MNYKTLVFYNRQKLTMMEKQYRFQPIEQQNNYE